MADYISSFEEEISDYCQAAKKNLRDFHLANQRNENEKTLKIIINGIENNIKQA